MSNRILILEDEKSVNRGIAFSLEKAGFETVACEDAKEARTAAAENEFDMLICDIGLPGESGLDFIKWFRQQSRAYIICLTALDNEADFVLGYEAGADDYITKPFSLSVLMLKIEAYFKRMGETEVEKSEKQVIYSGELIFYVSEMKISVARTQVLLSKNEWRLLKLFMENPGQVLSKTQILENAFDVYDNYIDDNTLAVNISRLREKIGDSSQEQRYIKNIRGLGYIWNEKCRQHI